MQDCGLIERLGGATKLAATLSAEVGKKVDREAIYKWRTQGIPWRWRPVLASIAQKSGVELPDDFLTGAGA